MARFSAFSFALGCLAGPLVLSANQEPSPRPSVPFPAAQEEDEPGLSPRERWRRKLERDLEGVWQVEGMSIPEFPYAEGPQGYFLFYREYVAFTLTASIRANVRTGVPQGLFQSGFKKYTVSAEGRFLLQNLMSVQRVGPEVERPLGGEVEERTVFFDQDTVRISRAQDDYIVLRRIATSPPAPRKPFPPRRALPLPAREGTPATMPGKPGG